MRRSHQPAAVLLLLVAVLAVLGHVCVLPAHAEDDTPGAHHSHDPGTDEGDDAVHAASCDAVRGSSPVVAPMASVARAGAGMPATSIVTRIAAEPPASLAPPPLFLLHASFLI